MTKKIKNFFKRLKFEFYLDIYLVTIKFRVHSEPVERFTYDIGRLQIDLLRKKVVEFDLYTTQKDRF